MLGKRNLFYFIDHSFKPFVHSVTQGVFTAVCKHIGDNFKYKYYDHDYTKCRIVPGIYNPAIVRMKYTDVAVVAAHFSRTYGSSDAYLSHCEPSFENNVMLLHSYPTPVLLFERFLDEYTMPNNEGTLPYKSMYFLWKVFVSKMTLPCVLSQHNYKQLLISKNIYDVDTDTCKVTSRFSLSTLNFELFWGQCMKEQAYSCYTTEELVSLYNEWNEMKNTPLSVQECSEWFASSHTQNLIGNLVQGFECKLWDKTVDIENAIEAYTTDEKGLYAFYIEYTSSQGKRVVSKDYFDHYLELRT
jgi:hypothetical protein